MGAKLVGSLERFETLTGEVAEVSGASELSNFACRTFGRAAGGVFQGFPKIF